MSFNSIRNLSTTAKKNILSLIGKVTLEDVKSLNGPKGDQWVSSVKKLRDSVETQYPTLTGYEIQGAKAHRSSKDPTDDDDVLTIAFYSQNGTRLLSGHVHEDGTYKLAESRAGKGKAAGK
ncbi:hypothetical protein KXV70_004899 [Aspergillus fumigatus]|nr:hypothetical protein KXX64_007073 [Aspergillus fumigatus]KAH1545497.1 hypothetical protein KXX57_004578 [Aspergillus fumigatus]KAH1601514.1 hypothetical protein KXX44_004104 [Aspergillus fumigatus]KAH2221184.1 hypothetical protein KXW71_002112 [Aspergillus fumigatus]KAH2301926.1 hypothetical protein KXV47_001674 [Aspergillus fumigatus]